jgi:hypothetical protein
MALLRVIIEPFMDQVGKAGGFGRRRGAGRRRSVERRGRRNGRARRNGRIERQGRFESRALGHDDVLLVVLSGNCHATESDSQQRNDQACSGRRANF